MVLVLNVLMIVVVIVVILVVVNFVECSWCKLLVIVPSLNSQRSILTAPMEPGEADVYIPEKGETKGTDD